MLGGGEWCELSEAVVGVVVGKQDVGRKGARFSLILERPQARDHH